MEVDLTRFHGTLEVSLAEKLNYLDFWQIRTDILEEYDNEDQNHLIGVTFVYKDFEHKPSMAEVKDFVYSVINAQTDEKILSGFVWNNIHVWLSAENQRNFSEAARMALEGQIELPVTFKIGEDKNGEAVYYTFETVEELTDFYADCFVYINQCLNDGWDKKDSVDWTPYEEALNEQV